MPQNDLIMHWALRVVGKKAARCDLPAVPGVLGFRVLGCWGAGVLGSYVPPTVQNPKKAPRCDVKQRLKRRPETFYRTRSRPSFPFLGLKFPLSPKRTPSLFLGCFWALYS